MILSSKHIDLRQLELNDAVSLLDLRQRNREFLVPWEPVQPESHFTLIGQQEAIEKLRSNWESGTGYGFGIFLRSTGLLVGRITLSNVVRGAWESCTLGYFLDQGMNGRGYMTEAVRLTAAFAFQDANLHRVQAAVMPKNAGSIRVLENVGFRYEGFAEYYLRINDVWEHHNLYSMTRENWSEVTY
ncbi:MAG: alanine acetyltransferase [Alicyclobacillus sp. RIFOXYA1_FULL_53_8]|nr:MAG: alanine acetyltransferase [Alicyclobacillus sp. RIFOXYA1_FULL_53_8]